MTDVDNPKTGETWGLRSDHANSFRIDYLNCCNIVGFSHATKRKRSFGTMKLKTLLARYERLG